MVDNVELLNTCLHMWLIMCRCTFCVHMTGYVQVTQYYVCTHVKGNDKFITGVHMTLIMYLCS